MATLTVCVLGPLVVTQGSEAVTAFESDKVRSLLAYLVVEADRPHPRETLAEFFWPNRPPGAALSNLRHALTILRRAIHNDQSISPYLLITRQSIQFNIESDFWSDAITFTHNVRNPIDNKVGIQALQEAAALVRGPFLEGLSCGDSAALEEWLSLKREHFHGELLQVLKRLTSYAELAGDYNLAINYARRQVELAIWDEQAYQNLMHLLALGNRQGEALALFEVCCRRLADELNVSPAAETVTLYERIQAGEFKSPLSEIHRQHIRGYELAECIGVGHVGVVYRAHQPVVARDVAIKIILPKFSDRPVFIRRFEAEARIIARLEHPHIVPLYDFWREPGGAYLVMRWLRRGSLHNSLAEGPWLAEPSARLIDQISAALAEAHLKGVIHQDVKPTNILLDEAGNAYLSDFGIAKMTGMPDTWEEQSVRHPYETPVTGTSSLGYSSPEAARGGDITAAADIYSLGVVIFELLTGRHPFPNLSARELIHKHSSETLPQAHLLRPELPAAVDGVIQQATAKVPSERFSTVQDLASAFHKALNLNSAQAFSLAATSTESLSNPYRGLLPFQEADAPFFFGREASIEQLVRRMREKGEGSRFLAVVGPSGSGKSSLIKAGLLPALKAGAVKGSENWYVVDLVPGDKPQEDLALILLSIAPESIPDLQLILERDDQGLLMAVNRILPNDNSELLLIIDQFEGLFTCATNSQKRDLLLDQIIAAAHNPQSRVRIVVGLRADFYDRPLANSGFSRLLGQRTVTIGPLSNEELIQAIEGPAQKAGVKITPGLVAKIVADMHEQPGALPMLQYTLTELFDNRRGTRLENEAYSAIGGLAGALVQRAESLYGNLTTNEQQMVRHLFLRLVALGGDLQDSSMPMPTTRRRILHSELSTLLNADDQSPDERTSLAAVTSSTYATIEKVVETFGAARLLTFNRDPSSREPTVEVAHEALLWEWPRLRGWLDESRDQLLKQRIFIHSAQEWWLSGQDPSFLLRGTRLDQFEQWAETTDLARTDIEQQYLDNSLEQRAAQRASESARRTHELALERRSRNFMRVLAGVLALAAVVASLLMLFAFSEQRKALESYSLSLTANAKQSLNDRDTATALVMAVAANQISDPPFEAQRTLLETAYAPGARQRYDVSSQFPGVKGPVTALAMSPDGQRVLLGLAEGPIILWDWNSGAEIQRLHGHTAQVNDVIFGPDGRIALSGADDGRVILWDLQSGDPLRNLAGHSGPVKTVDFNANGQLLLSGGYGSQDFNDPGQLILWEMASGREIQRFEGHKAGLIEAGFVLEDSAVLASSGDAELLTDRGSESEGQDLRVETILWDVLSGEKISHLTSFEHDAFALAISSDGQRALIGSYYDNIASLVDLTTGETLQVLEGHHDAVSALQIQADMRYALSGSHDGSLIFWDLSSGKIDVHFKVHDDQVTDVIMTPDGRSALSAARDGRLIRWDLYDAADVGHYLGHGDMVYDVVYLADGKRFLSISGGTNPSVHSQDTSVRLWDMASGQQLQVKDFLLEVLFQIDVTSDGKKVLVTGMSPTVFILDTSSLAEIGQLNGHQGWVTAVDITPDNRQAVTAAVDGAIILWDLSTQNLIRRIETGVVGGPWAVAISPDGRTALADGPDGNLSLWDLETGEKLLSFVLEDNNLKSGSSGVTFLPDGKSAIAQGSSGFIYHWDVQSGKLIRVLGRHNDIRTRIEIDPAGNLALSSGMDGVLMLWDLQSGELIRSFDSPGKMIFDIDISPDGLTALSGSADNSIIRWRLENPGPKDMKDWIAANRYLRELSCEERNLYQIEPFCSAESPE